MFYSTGTEIGLNTQDCKFLELNFLPLTSLNSSTGTNMSWLVNADDHYCSINFWVQLYPDISFMNRAVGGTLFASSLAYVYL